MLLSESSKDASVRSESVILICLAANNQMVSDRPDKREIPMKQEPGHQCCPEMETVILNKNLYNKLKQVLYYCAHISIAYLEKKGDRLLL